MYFIINAIAREFLKNVWGLKYKSNHFLIQMKTFRIKRNLNNEMDDIQGWRPFVI